MNVIVAEILKLRRAPVWLIVGVLPIMSVLTGTVNYASNLDRLKAGWAAYGGQVTVFYGLMFFSVGIAALASAVWRAEHAGNWPRLMAGPTSSRMIVTAKVTVLGVLIAAMQVWFLILAWAAGVLAAGLPVALPAWFVAGIGVAGLAGLSVAAWHCLLSMLIRSFAAPIAVAVLGCVLAIGLLMREVEIIPGFIPYALVTKALNLGNSAVTDGSPLTWAAVGSVVLPSLALTGVLVWLAGWILDHRDIRA